MPIEYYHNMRAIFCRQIINEKNISFSVGITRNFGQLAVVEALCGGSLGQKIIIFIEIVNCGLGNAWTLDISIMNVDMIHSELVTLRLRAAQTGLTFITVDKQDMNRIIFT